MKAAGKFPWFKCRQSALLGALAGLPENEGYAYVIVMLRIYEADGPVAEDAGTISRRTGMPIKRAQAAIDGLLRKGKLTRAENGAIDCPKTHADLAERRGKSSKAAKAGKISAESRSKTKPRKTKQNQSSAPAVVEQIADVDQQIANHKDLDLDLDLDIDSQFSNENCSAPAVAARPQKSQGEPKTPRAILETVLSAELAAGVIEHRQRKRAPLTALAAKGLVREFVACRDAPAGALMMIERGWQAFKASWFFNEQEKLNLGGGNGFDRQNGSSRGGEEGLGFAALAVRRAREASQNRQ